jgi:serine/threonine-protein kinase RsbW
MNTERWSFDATSESPGKGRRAIREFTLPARPTEHALGSIAVCVSEAITNAVVHAYRDMPFPGQIDMAAELDGDSLTVRVSDRGHGLEPKLESTGLGLGLPLISKFSATSEITSSDQGGTEVTMRFDLREQGEL